MVLSSTASGAKALSLAVGTDGLKPVPPSTAPLGIVVAVDREGVLVSESAAEAILASAARIPDVTELGGTGFSPSVRVSLPRALAPEADALDVIGPNRSESSTAM